MNFLNTFKKMSKLEVGLSVLFALFIVLPLGLPDLLANFIDSALGMLTLFGLTVYLFYHVSPVVAVLFVLKRRTSRRSSKNR